MLISIAQADASAQTLTGSAQANRAAAQSLYDRGEAAYKVGSYDEAIANFSAAYARDPVGAFLFNIAQAYRLKMPPDCKAALRNYELFLAAEPAASERTEVQQHMRDMTACVAGEEQAAVPSASHTARTSSEQAPRWPSWLVGSGVSLLAAGGITYAVARSKYREFEATCPCDDATLDRWKVTTNIAYASAATGGTVALIGLAAWLWPRSSSQRQETLHFGVPTIVSIQRGGAVIVTGNF